MSELNTTTPIPFNQTPCVISNGNLFYSIYGLTAGTNSNHVCGTIFDGTWRNVTFTKGNMFPPLMNNGIIKAILVGNGSGIPYVVYQSDTNKISIFSIDSSEITTFRISYTATNTISNFCLYTDNTYLYIITNESGVLWCQRLNSSFQLDTKFQLNGSGGKTAQLTNATGKLSAMIFNGNLNCVFESNAGITGIYQLSSTNWTFDTVVQGESVRPKGIELYLSASNNLKLILVYSMGSIDILNFTGATNNYWDTEYMSEASVPPSAGEANVGINMFGTFISYTDTLGNLQCIYSIINGLGWQNTQLSGNGAGLGFLPNAPQAASAPGVSVYNGIFYHAVYVTTSQQVYDAFWIYGWGDVSFYPSIGNSASNMTEVEKTNATMIP